MRSSVCAACGGRFEVENGDGPAPMNCPSCPTRSQRQAARDKAARHARGLKGRGRKAGGSNATQAPRECAWCLESFRPSSKAAKYCSARCGSKVSGMMRRYGLTVEGFFALWLKAGGRCEICNVQMERSPKSGWAEWHIDHDHRTGQVRGILCRGCNTAIGKFDQTTWRLRAAAEYLEERADAVVH